jgi:hypothetical protein
METPTPTPSKTPTLYNTDISKTPTIYPISTPTSNPSTSTTMTNPLTVNSNAPANIQPVANTGGVFDGMLFILNSLNSPPGLTPPINTANVSNSLAGINSSATQVLNNQGVLNNIIDDETEVLNNRLQDMNNSVNAAQRNLMLNESSRLKSQDYNVILYYFIGMIVFLNTITVLNRWYPYFSREMFDLIIIFTVFFVLYKVFWKYTDIVNRDTINYNELSLPKPGNVSMSQQQIISQNNINNRQLANQGMIFNFPKNNEQCSQQVTAAPVTTANMAVNGFTTMNELQPNSFNEFENYSKI